MDKPKKGNTITIKLNGEPKNVLEEPKKMDLEPIIESAPVEIKGESEQLDLDQQDTDVFLETAASQEPVDESFDWILPESSHQPIEEFTLAGHKKTKKTSLPKLTSFSTTTNPKKKKDRKIVPILISVSFAILIGTTIGVVMLKLVTTTPSGKAGNDSITTSVQQNTTTTGESTGTNTDGVTLEQVSTYVIQGGVFLSKDGAKETSDNVTSKGVPSQLIEMNNKQYLFLGVADSIETAKSLGSQYKEDGVGDVFAKPLTLDEKQVTGLNAKDKSFLKKVPEIYQVLSAATSTALLKDSLSDATTKSLTDIEDQLNTSGLKNAKVKKIKTELTNAVDKVNSFQKSKSTKSLSQAQQHLLNFINEYYNL